MLYPPRALASLLSSRLYLQGFSATLLRNIGSGGSYFCVFDTLRIKRAKYHNCAIKDLPVIELFVCGGIAGIFFWGPWYPIDVVKSTLYVCHISIYLSIYLSIHPSIYLSPLYH